MGSDLVDAVVKTSIVGNLRIVFGTYTNAAGSTGGAIVTGLNEIFYFNSNCMTSQSGTVNKAAISGGTVTLTNVSNEDGQWMAIGV